MRLLDVVESLFWVLYYYKYSLSFFLKGSAGELYMASRLRFEDVLLAPDPL